MHSELVSTINSNVSDAKAVHNQPEAGDHSITVDSSKILDVCRFLRNEQGFNVLQVIAGIDYPDRGKIEVAYVIADFTDDKELILKVEVDRGDDQFLPKVDSVCSVWKAADWQERETYDLIGVNFVGHPDLRRILCPYDWTGHPLRRDYVVQKEYNGMEVNPPEKINNADHFFGKKIIDDLGDPKKVSWSWKDNVDGESSDGAEE